MPQEPILPLGVCVWSEAGKKTARTVSYPKYVFEILNHAGLFHNAPTPPQLLERLQGDAPLQVLVTVGETSLTDDLKTRLTRWVEAGGSWISVGGVCGMNALLGATAMQSSFKNWGGGMRSLGEGYLAGADKSDHPALGHLNRPLHFFGGVAVQASPDAKVLARVNDAHGRETERPAIIERSFGKGRTLLIAPDVTGTIVRIQQGHGGITRDGVESPDGTSPMNDGVLKSDDGAVLDWLLDREPVPGAEGLSIFAQPIADHWRELLLRSIFYLARSQDVPLPLLWLYPRRLPALGHLSHDTDGNDPPGAEKLLATLASGEVKSTWCVILPGYDTALMKRIADAGHELGTHFDSMTDGHPWGEAHFDHQIRALKKMFFDVAPVTNKNHYLRWEGDTELWEWCAARGIQMDQTKGASKTGEAGFNFGTCHPYLPVRFDGSTIDVLELPTPTQDLCVFAPEAILEPLLKAAKGSHGILHLLFHPAHFSREDVPQSMLTAIRRGRAEGLEWWTGRQISAWERARRKVRVTEYHASADEAAGRLSALTLRAETELKDATVLWLTRTKAPATLSAWGFDFSAAVQTLKPGTDTKIAVA